MGKAEHPLYKAMRRKLSEKLNEMKRKDNEIKKTDAWRKGGIRSV